MKLVVAIVHDEDAGTLLKRLVSADFGVTKLASTGGFLKAGNTTLLIGVPAVRLDEVVHIIETSCRTRKEITTTSSVIAENAMMGIPIEISVGGATVFVIDIEKYMKL
ncbi:MAG: cyclic-di-AMP receptor [Bacillota bacterium]|nr:cyclic-di-AMP receptor [Bacillota bacterium]